MQIIKDTVYEYTLLIPKDEVMKAVMSILHNPVAKASLTDALKLNSTDVELAIDARSCVAVMWNERIK
jgi:hypothetical protein